jgi:hypothetical protein
VLLLLLLVLLLQVLAVARWAGVELARGYGQKGSFFGHPPFLELPDGQVVGGHDAVIRAIALVRYVG